MSLMNIQPRQLAAFLEVCRLQSFSKAAERIPMSQSGISMLIKALEADVGARLFDRTTRSVTPTEVGRKLQIAASRILTELGGFDEAIAGARAQLTSRLLVAATPMVSANLLPPVLRDFGASHPGVTINLSDVEVSEVRNQVLEGRADIGLGFLIKPAVGIGRVPLCKFRLMIVSPADGTAATLSPSRTWASTQKLPLIGLPHDNPIQSVIESSLKTIGRAHEPRPVVNFIGTLVAMVEAGLGHAVIPSFAMPECKRRAVAVSMLTEPAVTIELHAATRLGAERTAIMADFASAVKRAAARLAVF